MKNKAGFILLLMLFAFTGFLCKPAAAEETYIENVPYWWTGRNFSGRVEGVGKYKIIVIGKNNEKKEFEMNQSTRIFLRESEQLTKGMYVKITYKETKQINIAKAVREVKDMQ